MPFRAIKVKHFANREKVARILKLFRPAVYVAKRVASYQWYLFFKEGFFRRKANIKHIESELSERYKYTIQYHVVVPALESFISNVQNRFREIVFSSTLPEKTVKVLLCLNSRKEWLHKRSNKVIWIEKRDNEVIKEELEVTDEERILAKKIFKYILSRWDKPSFKGIQLILDSKCALIEAPENAKSFDLWIRVSTLDKGKPVYIPVSLNDYFNDRGGVSTQMVQITKDRDDIRVRLVKEIPVKDYEGCGVVSLDFGMNVLLTTDRGDLFGRSFYQKVKEYAEKIDTLERNLKRQGIKPKQSKRYQSLQHRLASYVKGEVRRILNRIISLYKPDTIVVENLKSFLRDVINNFPKSVKRILNRFGLREIRKKLGELEEEYGIKVIRINPAYSSQSCSNCGYVDEDNRRTRDDFECLCCGSRLHADVNGARNLRERLSDGWLHLYRKEQALSKQVSLFLDNLNTERFKCLWGKARNLLTQNPYFKKVLSNSSLT